MSRWLVPIKFEAIVHIVDEGDTETAATKRAMKQFNDRYTGASVFAEGKYVDDSAKVVRGETRRTNDG